MIRCLNTECGLCATDILCFVGAQFHIATKSFSQWLYCRETYSDPWRLTLGACTQEIEGLEVWVTIFLEVNASTLIYYLGYQVASQIRLWTQRFVQRLEVNFYSNFWIISGELDCILHQVVEYTFVDLKVRT